MIWRARTIKRANEGDVIELKDWIGAASGQLFREASKGAGTEWVSSDCKGPRVGRHHSKGGWREMSSNKAAAPPGSWSLQRDCP